MREINLLVIHCSASPNGRVVGLQDIDAWHKARGFKRKLPWSQSWQPELKHIGYHGVIGINGEFWPGRHSQEVGAHTSGHNSRSLGICLIGTDNFTAAQWVTLRKIVTDFHQRFPETANPGRTLGHRDLSPDIDGDGVVEPQEWLKTCPGFVVADWLEGGMQALPQQVYGARR